MKKTLYLSVAIGVFLIACKAKEKTTAAKVNCSNTNYTYEADIKPIMQEKCVRCHNTNMKAGYNFHELESVKKAGSNGYLLGTIKHADGYDAMPRMSAKLDQATIDKVECWINGGMK